MSDLNTLQECRDKIDALDSQIIDLIKQRMTVSEQVAKCKAESGKAVRDPARERAILLKAADMAGDDFKNEILTVYTTLFGLSRARQYNLLNHDKSNMVREIEQALQESPETLPEMSSAACCGTEDAYAFHAAEKLLRNPQITGFKSFSAAANAVKRGICQYGILPIEDSACGTVKQVCELMRENRFRIVRSVKLHIAQDRDVPDHDSRYIRFICISRNMEILPGANRISLMLNMPHCSGDLSRVIDRFAALGLNLLKLESLPVPGKDFELCFCFDFEASVRTPEVRELLNSLNAYAENITFLGNYQEF